MLTHLTGCSLFHLINVKILSEANKLLTVFHGLQGCDTMWTCGYPLFGWTCSLHLEPWRRSQYISLKQWSQPRRPVWTSSPLWESQISCMEHLLRLSTFLYFIPPSPKCNQQVVVLSYLQSFFFPQCRRPGFFQILVVLWFYKVVLIFSFQKTNKEMAILSQIILTFSICYDFSYCN